MASEWSGSERDLAVPKKRRRRQQLNNDPGVHDDEDDDEEDEDGTDMCSSRSSSLLQFECLERHCEDIFRTTASSEPFPQSPSVGSSSFSFDSLETTRWRFSGSQDSLEDDASSMTSSCSSSSEVTSSDDDAINRSFSSRSGNGSFVSSTGLRSFRSFDSLNLYQTCDKPEGSFLSGEFSQSLNNNALTADDNSEAAPTPRGIYKTVECLTEVAHAGCGRSPSKTSVTKVESEKAESEPKDGNESAKGGSQRSAENLSEDSGFGESCRVCPVVGDECASSCSSACLSDASRKSSSSVRVEVKLSKAECAGMQGDISCETVVTRGWEDACDARAKFIQSGWQSAPDLARRVIQSESGKRCSNSGVSVPSSLDLCTFSNFISNNSLIISYISNDVSDDDEDIVVIPETKSFVDDKQPNMASRMSVVSTPNLYKADDDFLVKERDALLKSYADSTASLSKLMTVKNKFESDTKINSSGSRGSNIMITTSFVNLSQHSGSSKGVHFCPVVSEVSWQDSFTSDDDEDDTESSDNDDSSTPTPPIEVLVEKLRGSPTPPPPRRASEDDRRRLVEELNKLKLEKEKENAPPINHVTRQTLQQRGANAVQPQNVMEERRNGDGTAVVKEKKHGISGFFQRFSFRRLSGRKKKNDKKDGKKKNVNSTSTTTVVNRSGGGGAAVVEDVQIIPLHPPSDDVDLSALVSKPPLPPQPPHSGKAPTRRPDEKRTLPSASADMATATATRGLLETDLDSDIPPTNKKTRSLLNLDDGRTMLKPSPTPREENTTCDSRAKSMEFLLDKENQAAIKVGILILFIIIQFILCWFKNNITIDN